MLRVLPCLMLLTLPALAGAQPAAPTALPPPPPRQEATAEFAFVSTTGNSSTQTMGLSGDYFFRPEDWVFRFRTAYVRNEAEDVLTAESFLFLFRAEHQLTPRLSAFGEYGYLRDEFAGIEHRNQVLGGLAYKLVDAAPHLLVADAGIGYANEQRVIGDDLSTAVWNAGLGYRLKLSENAEITDDLRFNQSFPDAGDWRLANIAAVTAKLTTILSLKLSNTVRYVHEPVAGFETTDTITAIALVAKFQSSN